MQTSETMKAGEKRYGFIGAGRMAQALCKGLITGGKNRQTNYRISVTA